MEERGVGGGDLSGEAEVGVELQGEGGREGQQAGEEGQGGHPEGCATVESATRHLHQVLIVEGFGSREHGFCAATAAPHE